MNIRKKLSEEHKQNISNSLKKSHNTGGHPGWNHINIDENRMSRPERIFKELLEKYKYYDKYKIIYGFSIKKFFLDFAIIDLKLDIEIDGIQHFRDDSAIQYDKDRDLIISNDGWLIYRISVKELYENSEIVMRDLDAFILSRQSYRKYNVIETLEKYKRIPKYGTRSDYMNAKKEDYCKKYKPFIKKIINSDIDFNKFGWVNAAADIIGIQPQRISRWMKCYMPEFYENNCFKRK